MDWVQIMRGPQKGNKRKRRGKDRASSSIGGAPAGPESPERSATAAGDGAEATDPPPSWVRTTRSISPLHAAAVHSSRAD
jgi:hypothetical protein